MQWTPFVQQLWAHQQLPPAGRYLLVQIAAKPKEGLPPAVAVGRMRFAAGDRDSPTFTIPGVGGEVTAWCDCLGDDFHAPEWPGTHKKGGPQSDVKASVSRALDNKNLPDCGPEF